MKSVYKIYKNGEEVSLPKTINYSRIVSLVPSQTETLYDLGLEENIVGLTKFCEFPIHLKKCKTIVGGTKQVHLDKIKVLQPSIIICNLEENTKEMVLELSHIAPVLVTEVNTFSDSLAVIFLFGTLFSKEEEANKWIQEIESAKEDFLNHIALKPKHKVAYFIWANPYMVAANNTFINEMLCLTGFVNAFDSKTRYPEIDILELKNTNLDFILLSSEPFPFKHKHVEELRTFVPNVKSILVDGAFFSWHGTRLKLAFNYFKKLHSQIKAL